MSGWYLERDERDGQIVHLLKYDSGSDEYDEAHEVIEKCRAIAEEGAGDGK